MSARLFVRSAGLTLVLAVTLVAALWALPAGAADTTVEIHDDGFHPPNPPPVTTDDTLTWAWKADGHSVVVQGIDGAVYDSHPDCSADALDKCGTNGLVKTWKPTVAGTFAFHCRVHPVAMTGTLTVTEPDTASSPSPTPSPSPEPTETGGEASPSPSPSPTSSDPEPAATSTEKTSEPSPTESSSTTKQPSSSSGDDPIPTPSEGTAHDPGIRLGPPGVIEPQPLPTILPSVAPSAADAARAVATPDLDEFPEGADPSVEETELGAVALDAPPRGPSPRTVWLGVGSASILATAGAFAKFVLFGAPWS